GAAVAGLEDLGREVSLAVRALPAVDPTTPFDLLLDGLTGLTLDGPAVAIPTLQRAAAAAVDLPVEDVMRWGWPAVAAGHVLWDDDIQHRILERHIRLLRDVGALAQLPVLLSALGVATAWAGDFAAAAVYGTESQSVAAVTGSPIAPYTA